MGTIHLAVAGGFGGFRKLFVVKELKPVFTHNEEFVRLFMREARLAARLSHPNVVHTIEADQEHDRFFMAMEFLDGQPFSELLRRAQKVPTVPLALRLSVICQALAGLHHAHELRDYDGRALEVIHRDVSPNNIFVTYDGQVKVLDFGVARALDGEGTQPRGFKGKIGYASPEQLRMLPGDRRIDVFAAGVVMWEAIALRNLVRGRPLPQVFQARLNGTEPRISQIVPEIDPALAVICERAMATDPDERYPSADALRQELEQYLDERKLACDPAMVAQLMRTKFSEERANIHHLIDEQLRSEEDVSQSFIATRDPLLSAARAAPRLERDEDVSAAFAPPARRRNLSVTRGVVVACVLGAAAATFRVYSHEDEGGSREPPRSDPSAREQAPEPKPLPTESAAPASPDSPRPENSGPTPASRSEATAAPSLRPQKAKAPVVRGSTASPRALEPSVQRDASSVHEAPREAPSAPAERDVDLRRLSPAGRRSIDLDNPFR